MKISLREEKIMFLNRKIIILSGLAFLTSLLVNCQEKKKNNNTLALGAVAIALSNVDYKVSGQVTLSKKMKKRNSGTAASDKFHQTNEEEDFFEFIPNAKLKIDGGAEITADDSGYFSFPALKNGSYKITITRQPDPTKYTNLPLFDCTGIPTPTSTFSTVPFIPIAFIPIGCSFVTNSRDSIAPNAGSEYQVGSFTLEVNGETAIARDLTAGVDASTSNARYNPLYFTTEASSWAYDKAPNPSLAVRFLTSETVRVVGLDTACDRTKKDCLQSLLYGTWLMTGKQQIPPNILGLPESTFSSSALCYHQTRVIARKAQGTDAVFSVENRPGTPVINSPTMTILNYCNNDQPSSELFSAPTVSTSVSITPRTKDCFDINISYNLVRQEGRGKFSADAKTLELELYNGGLNPSNHRCENGAVGDTSAIPGSGYPTVATVGASNPSGRPASAVQKYTRQ